MFNKKFNDAIKNLEENISNPFSNVAGFPEVVVVFPLNPGSVYVTSNSTNIGGSTEKTLPLNDNTFTDIFSFMNFIFGIWKCVINDKITTIRKCY